MTWADGARHCRGPRAADRLVPGMPASGFEPDPADMAARYSAGTAVSGKCPTRTLIEIALKQAGLIARAEFDFKEDGLSRHLGSKAYRFNLAHIEPRLDIQYRIGKRGSEARLHIDRIASKCDCDLP
jgi:hypothetical protein